MTISYNTPDEFYDGIYALTVKGLTFEADGSTLKITLTGGF